MQGSEVQRTEPRRNCSFETEAEERGIRYLLEVPILGLCLSQEHQAQVLAQQLAGAMPSDPRRGMMEQWQLQQNPLLQLLGAFDI